MASSVSTIIEESSPIEKFIFEKLLNERKEQLSLQIADHLHNLLDYEVDYCSCDDRNCVNRRKYILIPDIETKSCARQVEVRTIGIKQLYLQNKKRIPAHMAIRPYSRKHRDNAALIIQKYWRETNSNPNYKICRKRWSREFSDMS